MTRITVPLDQATLEKLRQLAERELRDPRQQAAALIVDGLRREVVKAAAPTSSTKAQR